MMTAELRCRCGTVQGTVADVGQGSANRMICYCDDCQAFLHHLGRTDLLDAHGGTEVIQVAPASLSFQRGADQIACLRLSPNGLYRWYARCCNTPLGNTLRPKVPFVGVVVQAFADSEAFGPVLGAVQGKFAIGSPPKRPFGATARMIARALGKVAAWRVAGKMWPHPFFEREGEKPRYPITVLSRAEREALRPLCGPTPAAPAHA